MNHRKYVIRNGLLHKDGKPIFAIGTSYYPSYHEKKVSVPEDHDRVGEMKKDLRRMADAGIHLVRCVSLGKIWYDKDQNVCTDTPFIDEMIDYAEQCELGVMVRLQGYSMNLSSWSDATMLDSHGNPMNRDRWWDFIQNSFFHEGIVRDNGKGTAALATHFAKKPGVLGFQTYNEPHYPSCEIFDYHPKTVAAFRKWLCKYMPEEDAMKAEPPRERPASKKEDARLWVLWRMFSMKALSDFLNHCSDIAKDATGIETMTCLTADPTTRQNAGRGVNFFDSAERMDALGITQYYTVTKPEAYLANMNLDLAESAASTYAKPLWIVEYDARTDIPPAYFRRLNYLALGSGCKSIMHYQWRGDYIFPDSPEGNGFGFLNYDGSETNNFGNAMDVIALINKLSDFFVHADKMRPGVAILHSDYAYMNADGRENRGAKSGKLELQNSWRDATLTMYTELRRLHISPDFTRAVDLKRNPLGVKVLFVPSAELISHEERALLDEFGQTGGKVVYRSTIAYHCTGYIPVNFEPGKYGSVLDMEDALAYCNVGSPLTVTAPSHYLLQTLKGNGYRIAVVTNISNIKNDPAGITLEIDSGVQSAHLYTFENRDGIKLPLNNGRIALQDVKDGAIVIFRESD